MNIKKVINQKGWTLERLAAQMVNTRKEGNPKGVSQATMSQIINGNPTIDKLQQIASIMGITLEELVHDEDSPMATYIKCPHCGKDIEIKTIE